MRRLGRRFKRRWAPQPALILMYHRVADVTIDPWGLCVSPQHFAEHLEVLRKNTVLVRLQDLTRMLAEGTLPRRAVAVTFDDGYADNLYHARPLLERHEIPATFFLAAGYLGSQREFWWDALEQLILYPEAQSSEEGSTQEQRYYALWKQLYALPESDKRKTLDALFKKQGMEVLARPTHRLLSKDEAVTLAAGKLVEIGAHTMTHPALGLMPVAAQRAEIVGSKMYLEELVDQPVTSFSYPHGHYTLATVSLVREAGFRYACTTTQTAVEVSMNCFELPRVQVSNIDGDVFARQLRTWSEVAR